MKKVTNPSAAGKRRQALSSIQATGSLEGIHKAMLQRFQEKGYLSREGNQWTLTKWGRAVMEGRIGAAGRGAVDMGSARHKAERSGSGRRRAKGADMAQYMLGDGTSALKRLKKEEKEYWEAEGARLAKEHQTQEKALDSVLGTGRQVYAVKLALQDRPFRKADLEALQAVGWTLRSAGTVPAKVGRTLAALNPSDMLDRLLGPRGEVRAVVIQSPAPFGEDLVRQLRADGYDVSPAPKHDRDTPATSGPRQKVTGADTGLRKNPEAGPMKKTTGRKTAAKGTSKMTPRRQAKPATSARAKKPARPTSLLKKKINTATAKAPKRAKKSPARVKTTGRAALRFNPGSTEALAKVWKAWTGAEPNKVFQIEVDDAARHKLPAKVVLLGRVSWLATQAGEEKRFGEQGPFMVTDGEARRVWLVSSAGHRFDLEPALIGYLARKPKFGDREPVEYVHAFEGRAHAVMNGQVGALTGTFRITPAGLEG